MRVPLRVLEVIFFSFLLSNIFTISWWWISILLYLPADVGWLNWFWLYYYHHQEFHYMPFVPLMKQKITKWIVFFFTKKWKLQQKSGKKFVYIRAGWKSWLVIWNGCSKQNFRFDNLRQTNWGDRRPKVVSTIE